MFFISLLLCVDLAYFFKRGVGQTAAVANFILIFILYLGGLFADMRSAMYAFFAVTVLLTVYMGYRAARYDGIGEIKSVLKNGAFYVYVAAGLAFGFVFLNFTVIADSVTDASAHWGLVVKNMFAFDNFGNLGDTTTMFNQYVPASGIFLYAFQFLGSRFSEGALYSAFDLLLISMLLPVLEFFKKKTAPVCILAFVLAVVETVLFKVSVFRSILVDVLIAVMMAHIYVAYKADKDRMDGFTVVNVALSCFVLTATKSSGLALAIFALIFVVIDLFTVNKSGAKAFFADRVNIAVALLPIVIIAFAKLSWSWYIDFYDLRPGWNASEMTFENIMGWLSHPDAYQQQVTTLFMKTFFLGNGYGVQIPQILGTLLTAGACFAIWYKTRSKAFAIAHGCFTLVTVIGYGIYLMLLYLFSFAYAEGLILASYTRYMSSIWLGIALIYIYLLVDLYAVGWNEKFAFRRIAAANTRKLAYSAAAVTATVGWIGATLGAYFGITAYGGRASAPYSVWAETVKSLGMNDRVYIIISDEQGKGSQSIDYLIMRYMATPVWSSGYFEGGNYAEGRDVKVWYTGNPFSSEFTSEQLREELSGYTHVYLHDVWQEFEVKYGELFADGIEDDTLYKIEVADGDLRLKKE